MLDGELWSGRHGHDGEFSDGLPPNIYPLPNLELLRHLLNLIDVAFATVHDMISDFDPIWPAIDERSTCVCASFLLILSDAAATLDLDAVVLGGIPKPLAKRVITNLAVDDQVRLRGKRPAPTLVPTESTTNPLSLGAALLPLQTVYC